MATKTWNGSTADWFTAADWTGATVPASGDNVIISSGDPFLQSGDLGVTVASITLSGTLGLDGTAALTVTGAFASSGTLDLDTGYGDGGGSLTIGGTLDNTNTVQVGSGDLNLSAATTLTLGGLVNPSGASFQMYGSGSHPATLAFSGGAGFTSNGGTFGLTNTTPLTLSNAFTNSGTFGLAGDAALTVTGAFANSGTLDLDTGYGDGGGSLTIGGTLDNTNTVQVGSGDLNLSAVTTLTLGGLVNPSGASFQMYGSGSHPATLAFSGGTGFTSNGGTFGLTNTTPLTLSNAFTNSGTFGLAGDAALTVTGAFANSGTLDLDTGYGDGGGSLTIGGTLDNTNTVQVGSGDLNLSAATTLTLGGLVNPSGASFQMYGSGSHPATLAFSGGAGFTSNGGTFGLTNTTPLTLSNAFTNSGTFGLAGDAALTVTGAFANSGTLDLDTGYGDGGGSLTIGGTLDNTNTVQVGSGDLNLSAATTLTLGGLVNPSGASFQMYGSGSHPATLAFSGGAGFTSNGGTFGLTNTTPLTLSNAFTNRGTFGLAGDAALTVTGTFDNSGTLDLDTGYGDGGGSLTIGGTLDNANTVQVGSGYLILSAATTLTLGGLTNPTGASFAVFGSASHAATVSVNGNATSYGSLDIGTFANFTVTDGTAYISSVTNDGVLEATNDAAIVVTGAIAGTGQFEIGSGSEVELGSATGRALTFEAKTGKLRIDNPATQNFPPTIISDFSGSDILELANTNAISATPTFNGSNTTLAVNLSGGGALFYTLAGNLSADTFGVRLVNGGADSDITIGPVLGGAGNTLHYTKGGAAVVVDSGLTVGDAGATTLVGATVSITGGSLLAGDVLAATTTGTAITASYNAATGVLSLSGSDPLAHYQAVLDSVSYRSTSLNPTNTGADPTRTISWVASDSSQRSGSVTSTIDVSATRASADFNGDGYSDFLWQKHSGQPAIWEMNGTNVIGSGLVGANPGPSWHVIGSGDFYDDAHADILWQNTNGQAAIWEMNGTNVIGSGLVGPNPGPSWQVKGSGDFYDNGYSDILWQNTDGQAAIWEMNGTNVIGGDLVGANPGPSWHVIGSGDFYDNGYSDILWQNTDGQAAIWEMNGTSVIGGGTLAANPGPSWHAVATGDFYDNGYSDILWQNSDGQAAIWEMNGINVIGGGLVGANPGPSWQAIGTGDFYGNGHSDILWQNTNGQAVVWEMDGTSVNGGGPVGSNLGPSWHLYAG